MAAVVSWSGGKDGCLAYYKAVQQGLRVRYLLNIVSKEGKVMAHGLDPGLIVAQSKALGVPVIQREATRETYEEVFKEALRELRNMGVRYAVFGNIQEFLDWVSRVCGNLE